jgi:hypothetical protein
MLCLGVTSRRVLYLDLPIEPYSGLQADIEWWPIHCLRSHGSMYRACELGLTMTSPLLLTVPSIPLVVAAVKYLVRCLTGLIPLGG